MQTSILLELIRKPEKTSSEIDEINARVWCLKNKKTYRGHTQSDDYGDSYGKPILAGVYIHEHHDKREIGREIPYANVKPYYSSIDAQADLLPGGWEWSSVLFSEEKGVLAFLHHDTVPFTIGLKQTKSLSFYKSGGFKGEKAESVARLDAIVQVLGIKGENDAK